MQGDNSADCHEKADFRVRDPRVGFRNHHCLNNAPLKIAKKTIHYLFYALCNGLVGGGFFEFHSPDLFLGRFL